MLAAIYTIVPSGRVAPVANMILETEDSGQYEAILAAVKVHLKTQGVDFAPGKMRLMLPDHYYPPTSYL